MAVIAGSAATVYASNGSTAFTGAATTKLVANTVYQLSLAANQRLDPTVNLTVKANGVTAAVGTYTVDYAFGKITFAADQGSATITADGAYVSVFALADVTEIEWTEEIQSTEYVAFGGSGYTSRLPTTITCSGTMTSLKTPQADYDATGATRTLDERNINNHTFLIEVALTGGPTYRCWAGIGNIANKLSAEGTYEGTLSWSATPFKGLNQYDYAAFGWSS